MRNLILSTLSILALLIHPLSLLAQNSFSVSLDVDGAAGDQAITSINVSADRDVAIQIFGKDIQNAIGLAVRFEYDASQVTYEGFDVDNVLPNAQALIEHGTNPTFVEIGIAALGGQATANSGLVGTARFRTTAAFSGTAIRLVRAELGRGGRFETITLNTSVELKLQVLTLDFNEDGVVNFIDFLAFVGHFGTRRGDGKYEAKYDLDSDDAIGFGDFLIFSSSFGTETGGGREETQVTIPDANLRVAIETALGKARGAPITRAEMASLTSLEASSSEISDLTGLEFATGLIPLNLSYNIISDITPLSGLIKLTSLDLSYNIISDITPLSGLTNLTSLDLSNNIISDITPLSGLTNLRSLRLHDNFFSDISPLSGLTRLISLSLYGTIIRDSSLLSRLSNLSEANIPDANLRAAIKTNLGKASDEPITSFEMAFLSELEAPNANISDLTGLELATNLTWLHLGYDDTVSFPRNSNNISDFSPLSHLIRLRTLDLADTGISDITLLSNLTSLEILYLGSNDISDVSVLSNLTNLEQLHLSNNDISDVSALSNLTSLERLNLYSNDISDVSVLSNLTSLRLLDLSRNDISDVSALSSWTSLDYLFLYNNNITDLSPLVANRGLGRGDWVDVRNNPLSATSLNTHIPALRDRGVDVRFGALKPAVEKKERRMPHPENEDIVNGGMP